MALDTFMLQRSSGFRVSEKGDGFLKKSIITLVPRVK